MNGKQAKKFRRLVRKETADIPLQPRTYITRTAKETWPPAPWVLAPDSFRFAMRYAKKMYRRARRVVGPSPAVNCDAFCIRGSERCILGGYR